MRTLARIVIAWALCLLGTAHAAVLSVGATPGSVQPGDTVTASLSLELSPGETLSFAEIHLGFDASAFSFLLASPGGLLPPDWFVSAGDAGGDVTVSAFAGTDVAGPASGIVAVLDFIVDPAAAPGLYDFSILSADLGFLALVDVFDPDTGEVIGSDLAPAFLATSLVTPARVMVTPQQIPEPGTLLLAAAALLLTAWAARRPASARAR